MTAAAISKRIKAKGLGRLRWYCQMCEKQCRDENGFKNHAQSNGHQRQLSLFSENPHEYIGRFSESFQTEFLLVLRRRYGTSMVSANTVYQEYIKDRDHLHMTATRWTTLSDFVKEMGRSGLCRVEDREDGWWMSFVDRSAAEKDRKARDIDRMRVAEEERAENMLKKQLEMAKQLRERRVDMESPSPQKEVHVDRHVSVEMAMHEKRRKTLAVGEGNALAAAPIVRQKNASGQLTKRKPSRFGKAPKLSALEEIMRAGQKEIQQTKGGATPRPSGTQNDAIGSSPVEAKRADKADYEKPWIVEGILVKMINTAVGNGTFTGKKGRIIEVIDNYGAQVKMIDSKVLLEVDQDDLQTVIPKPGGEVLLLRDPYRGKKAVVKSINIESFSVTAILAETGEEIRNIEYEAVSRIA